ncbi:taste receptor type 2 member 14-like [Sciurus carolinensis]|uniref:taste receptor type 2 member 14-like n=1 Tax=Sciurus carolinensis TaxID=30640 RepID=UPI001FB4C989|nr:taste receptor type 2 member 14-like [Sciurus carolinensis]
MGCVIQSVLTVILSVELIIGNLGNGFIVVVNCMDWIKRRKITSVEQILTALAISRIGVLWLVLLSWWISVLYPTLRIPGKIFRVVYISLRVSSHFSFWFATCLGIFYFLKIANFSNSVFLYLKWRVKKVVSVTLLVSLVLLFINLIQMNIYIDIWIDGSKRNMSYNSSSWNYVQFYKVVLFTNSMFMFVPFTVSLATFLLLIISLRKHLKRMQHKAKGSRDASTTAHVKALQTVIAFLLLYSVYFVSFLLQVWSFELLEKSPIVLFVWATKIVFPSGHSYVLILGNCKLRQTFLSLLWWLSCRSKDARPKSGP